MKSDRIRLYNDQYEHVKKLTRPQIGDLFTALMCDANDENLPAMDDETRAVFDIISATMYDSLD